MKIVYLGPSDSVNVAPYGAHGKDEVKDYPDEFAEELVATSRRQKFGPADDGKIATSKRPEALTVAELHELLDKLEIEYDPKAKKAELVALVEKNTAPAPEE